MSWKLSRTVLRGAVGGNTDCLLDRKPESGSKVRVPFVFGLPETPLFAFAGLWDAWKDAEGRWLQTFTIITTEANELMSAVHTRMPVILAPSDYDRWLSRDASLPGPVDLLRPWDSHGMRASLANPLVGSVRNNGPEMLVCGAPINSA